jgi:hypothetical protein
MTAVIGIGALSGFRRDPAAYGDSFRTGLYQSVPARVVVRDRVVRLVPELPGPPVLVQVTSWVPFRAAGRG